MDAIGEQIASDEEAARKWFAYQKWPVHYIPSWNMEEEIMRAFRCGITYEREKSDA